MVTRIVVLVGLVVLSSSARAQADEPQPEPQPQPQPEPQPEPQPPEADAPDWDVFDEDGALRPTASDQTAQVAPAVVEQVSAAPTGLGPDVVLLVGADIGYAPAGDNAPLTGGFEFGVTTRTLELGYFVLRTVGASEPLTDALRGVAGDGYTGRTQACYLCFAVGFRVRPLHGGFATAGITYDNFFIGTDYGVHVTGLGGEGGFMRRKGPYFVQGTVALQAMIDDGDYLGPRLRLEARAYWRGFFPLVPPLAVYGHLGYAYGNMDFGDGFTHEVSGAMLQVGLAYVSR